MEGHAMAKKKAARSAKAQPSARKRSPPRKKARSAPIKPGSHRSPEWKAAAKEVRAAVEPILARRDELLAADEPETGLPRSVAFTLNEIELSDTMGEVLGRHGFRTRGQIGSPHTLLERLRLIRPDQIRSAFERADVRVPDELLGSEADKLWAAARAMWKAESSMPDLPARSTDVLEGLIALKGWCVCCAAGGAYNAAGELVSSLATVAHHARLHVESEREDEEAKSLIPAVSHALVMQHDLGALVTSEVVGAARAVYTPASMPPRVGNAPQAGSVMGAVTSSLGLQLRNSVYPDRRTPLDPDVVEAAAKARTIREHGYGVFMEEMREVERHRVIERLGIRRGHDAMMVFSKDLGSLEPRRLGAMLRLLVMRTVDFDDLAVRLDVEAGAVIEQCAPKRSHLSAASTNLESSLLTHRPGTWYEQAYDFITETTGLGLQARDLRLAQQGHNLRATKAKNGRAYLYRPLDVIEHPKFLQFKAVIIQALERGFEGRPKYLEGHKKLIKNRG